MVGTFLSRLFFLTFFWQTRFPLCCGYQRIDYAIPFFYLSDLLFLLWVLSILANTGRRKSFFSFLAANGWTFLFLGLFLGAGLISNLEVDHQVAAFYRWLKVLEMGWVSLVSGWWIWRKRSTASLLSPLFWGLVPLCLLAIVEFVFQKSLGLQFMGEWRFTSETQGVATFFWRGSYWLRPPATFPHPNVLGGVLAICLFLVYYYRKQFEWWLVGTLSFLFAICLLLSFSRTAWIVLLFEFASYFFISELSVKQKAPQFSRKKILVISLFLLFVFAFVPNPIRERVTSLWSTDQLSWLRRKELARVSWRLIKDSPLLGVGMNQFPWWVERVGRTVGPSLWVQPVHNLWLLVAAENGLLGLFLWVLYWSWLISRLINQYRRKGEGVLYLLVILGGVLVISLFDHYWWTSQQGLMFMGVILGLAFYAITPPPKTSSPK